VYVTTLLSCCLFFSQHFATCGRECTRVLLLMFVFLMAGKSKLIHHKKNIIMVLYPVDKDHQNKLAFRLSTTSCQCCVTVVYRLGAELEYIIWCFFLQNTTIVV